MGFCQIFNDNPLCKRKAPLLKTFLWRFWFSCAHMF